MENLTQPLTVAGIRLGTVCAGIKYPDRRDLVVIEAAVGTRVAAVFTRNAFRAAPVTVARVHLAAASPRYLLINTGNANAGTGRQGLADAEASCQTLAELAGCTPLEVLPFSTGVIGEPLPLAGRRLGRRRARDHDHRHPTQMGLAATDFQRAGSHRYRDCQRRGDDSARYGDDAGLHRHGCRSR